MVSSGQTTLKAQSRGRTPRDESCLKQKKSAQKKIEKKIYQKIQGSEHQKNGQNHGGGRGEELGPTLLRVLTKQAPHSPHDGRKRNGEKWNRHRKSEKCQRSWDAGGARRIRQGMAPTKKGGNQSGKNKRN